MTEKQKAAVEAYIIRQIEAAKSFPTADPVQLARVAANQIEELLSKKQPEEEQTVERKFPARCYLCAKWNKQLSRCSMCLTTTKRCIIEETALWFESYTLEIETKDLVWLNDETKIKLFQRGRKK